MRALRPFGGNYRVIKSLCAPDDYNTVNAGAQRLFDHLVFTSRHGLTNLTRPESLEIRVLLSWYVQKDTVIYRIVVSYDTVSATAVWT